MASCNNRSGQTLGAPRVGEGLWGGEQSCPARGKRLQPEPKRPASAGEGVGRELAPFLRRAWRLLQRKSSGRGVLFRRAGFPVGSERPFKRHPEFKGLRGPRAVACLLGSKRGGSPQAPLCVKTRRVPTWRRGKGRHPTGQGAGRGHAGGGRQAGRWWELGRAVKSPDGAALAFPRRETFRGGWPLPASSLPRSPLPLRTRDELA